MFNLTIIENIFGEFGETAIVGFKLVTNTEDGEHSQTFRDTICVNDRYYKTLSHSVSNLLKMLGRVLETGSLWEVKGTVGEFVHNEYKLKNYKIEELNYQEKLNQRGII